MFSSSGLVFPGPPRRRGPQPSPQPIASQPKSSSDQPTEIADLPSPRPYSRRPDTELPSEPIRSQVIPFKNSKKMNYFLEFIEKLINYFLEYY